MLKRFVLTLLISCVVLGAGASFAQAKNNLLVFTADWCPWCPVFDAELQVGQVGKLVYEQYNLQFIDVGRFDRNQDLIERYGVRSIPFMVITDESGNHIVSQETGVFEVEDTFGHSIKRMLEFLQRYQNY